MVIDADLRMISDYKKDKNDVVIFGDTSKFHAGSMENYLNFRNLVDDKYNILSEIGFDFFFKLRKLQTDYDVFREKLIKSKHWPGIQSCSIIIVHGEGTTAKFKRSGLPYMYFAKLAKEMGKKCWLTNFSMFEIEGYADYLPLFDFIACRERITYEEVQKYNDNVILSFDCCILRYKQVAEFNCNPVGVALIRGSNQSLFEPYITCHEAHFYEFAWRWELSKKLGSRLFKQLLRKIGLDIRDGIYMRTFQEYVDSIAKNTYSLTTSYHANIISFLAGVPFVSLDTMSNSKFTATVNDLLPPKYHDMKPAKMIHAITHDQETRQTVHDHYTEIFDGLLARAKNNVN